MNKITRVNRKNLNISEQPLRGYYNSKVKLIRITDYHVGVADWNYIADKDKLMELIVQGYDIEMDVISGYPSID